MRNYEDFYAGVTEAELRLYLELVYSELRYCPLCQPYDEGIVWVLGRQIDIQILFAYLSIPSERWEDVAAELVCPNCGNQDIDLDTDVGTRPLEEVWIDQTWEEWRKKYGERLNEFYKHLEKFPYLGLDHDIGREIFDAIAKFPTCEIKDGVWFRSRNISSSKRMTHNDMYPPEPNVVAIPEGRYNHHGQAMFYLSESDEGAAKERLDDESGVFWMQKFNILHMTGILDLTIDFYAGLHQEIELLAFGMIYGRDLTLSVERSKGWKPEYFIPRFIADCARLGGFNGIKYKSSRSPFTNIVLFSWDKKYIVPVGEPTVFTFLQRQEQIIDKQVDVNDIPF